MRPRINQSQLVLTNKGLLILNREPKKVTEKAKRRIEFEKQYNKREMIFHNIPKSLDLIEFSNAFEQQIKQFKQRKQNEKINLFTSTHCIN